MTKQTYIKLLKALFVQANMADSEQKQDWQDSKMAWSHCNPIGHMLSDLMGDEDYNTWIDHGCALTV